MEVPAGAIAEWLKAIYKEIIDAKQARDSFNRVLLLGNEAFHDKREALSDDADRAILAASFAGDIPAMKKYLEGIKLDVLDVIIFRFHCLFDQLEKKQLLSQIPDHGLQVPGVLRLLLIVNDSIRRGPGGLN